MASRPVPTSPAAPHAATSLSPAKEDALAPPNAAAGGGRPSSSSASKTIRTLSPPILKHLQNIYTGIAGKERSLSLDEARKFLKGVQGDDIADAGGLDGGKVEEDGKESTVPTSEMSRVSVIDSPSPQSAPTSVPATSVTRPFLKPENGLDDFLTYMTSPSSSVLRELRPDENDLGFPLSNYFISSSHNTYLTGNQLNSDASAGAYRDVRAISTARSYCSFYSHHTCTHILTLNSDTRSYSAAVAVSKSTCGTVNQTPARQVPLQKTSQSADPLPGSRKCDIAFPQKWRERWRSIAKVADLPPHLQEKRLRQWLGMGKRKN